jgi:hypothetical protein
MPWYYAGPEAKPVGPVTLDELHACRVQGTVTPETYVIEHTGQPSENWAWKRYHDVFPSIPLPPLFPPPAPAPPAVQSQAIPPQGIPPQANPPHPLFPSAAPAQHPVFTPAVRPDPYYNVKPTNGWCAWGFGLSLAVLCLTLITCGFGGILGFAPFLLCIMGLVQVHKNREQAGQGLAIAGLILSAVALLISLIVIISVSIPFLKAHGLTVTEQTSNDSQ